MKKLASIILCSILTACSGKTEPSREQDAQKTEEITPDTETGPSLFPRVAAPAISSTSTPGQIGTTSPQPEDQSTSVAVTPRPTRFPALMSRNLEMQEKLAKFHESSGSLPKQVVGEIRAYAKTINDFTLTDAELTKEKRDGLMNSAARAEYEAGLIEEGNVQQPFDRRLQAVKDNIRYIQDDLSD